MKYRGMVQKGKRRGATLGFPTVNIEMIGETASGIFAATVSFDDAAFPAAAYADPSRGLIEAHLLDFNEDLYEKEVEIELLEKIRDAEKFADEATLKAAIADDITKVREYFNK